MQIATRFAQVLAFLLLLAIGAGDALAQRGKKEENEFPNATRSEPRTLKISEANSKKINQAYELLDEGEDAKARELLQGILDNAKSSPYEKALCLQGGTAGAGTIGALTRGPSRPSPRYRAGCVAGAMDAAALPCIRVIRIIVSTARCILLL